MNVMVNIDVDDLDRAIDFYTRGFGLRLVRRLFDETVAEMAGAPVTIHLLLKAAGTGAAGSSTRRYQRHWTPVHLDFEVEDIEAAVQRVRAAGGVLEGEMTSHAWGRLATMSDPFGHGLCVVELSGAGYDAAS